MKRHAMIAALLLSGIPLLSGCVVYPYGRGYYHVYGPGPGYIYVHGTWVEEGRHRETVRLPAPPRPPRPPNPFRP